jgi:hypothetical protein
VEVVRELVVVVDSLQTCPRVVVVVPKHVIYWNLVLAWAVAGCVDCVCRVDKSVEGCKSVYSSPE